MARDDVPYDVLRSEDDPVSALANAARLTDLVIASRSGGLAGELALASRTPVLALPEHKALRSEEHTSELQSLMRITYAVFCFKTKTLYSPNHPHPPRNH